MRCVIAGSFADHLACTDPPVLHYLSHSGGLQHYGTGNALQHAFAAHVRTGTDQMTMPHGYMAHDNAPEESGTASVDIAIVWLRSKL